MVSRHLMEGEIRPRVGYLRRVLDHRPGRFEDELSLVSHEIEVVAGSEGVQALLDLLPEAKAQMIAAVV